jgi:iron complex transport system permease protein
LGVVVGAGVVLVAALVFAVGNGTLEVAPWTVVTALVKGVTGARLEGLEGIVVDVRLPRVLMAALVGASLALAGAAMQGLFRNPLADPYLLGVASGASLGATVAILGVGGAAFTAAGLQSQGVPSSVPVFAFLGALGAVTVTLVLSRFGRSSGTEGIVLAGVVVGSLCTALGTYLILQDPAKLRAAFTWSLGSLSTVGYDSSLLLFLYALPGALVTVAGSRYLDALQLGDDTARTLGVRVGVVRAGLIAGSSLMVAAAVSVVGIIGFVGLVAPHIARRLGAVTHRWLLPASALVGASVLVLADLGARVLVRPAELPVGVVTTLVGGSFFLWLLARRQA